MMISPLRLMIKIAEIMTPGALSRHFRICLCYSAFRRPRASRLLGRSFACSTVGVLKEGRFQEPPLTEMIKTQHSRTAPITREDDGGSSSQAREVGAVLIVSCTGVSLGEIARNGG